MNTTQKTFVAIGERQALVEGIAGELLGYSNRYDGREYLIILQGLGKALCGVRLRLTQLSKVDANEYFPGIIIANLSTLLNMHIMVDELI